MNTDPYRSDRPAPADTVPATGLIAALVASAALLATACTEAATPSGQPAADAPFDVLLTGARVVDGAGNPWFRAARPAARSPPPTAWSPRASST